MDFWGDRRGQPVQIGFILLFGILVLAFASYQGYVVPNQNAEIEFNHFQTVGNEFTEFRSNLVNAVDSDADRSNSFTLGTRYPSRLIALNPPPVAGTIRTTDPGEVTVESDGGVVTADVCGSDNATSRSLVYRPQFNEHRNAEAITYENNFVAREYRAANQFGEQRLVRPQSDGPDRIDLLLLNGSVSLDGGNADTIDITASSRRTTVLSNPNVTVPSRYSASQWRDDILNDVGGVQSVTKPTDGLVEVSFDGNYVVNCAVAGLNQDPTFGPGISDGGSDTGGINPAAPGDVRLEDEELNSKRNMTVVFNNTAGTVNLSRARINYYQYTGGNDKKEPEAAYIYREGNGTSGSLEARGDFVRLEPEIRLDGQSTSRVRLDFHNSDQQPAEFGSDDWFVLTIQFETGEQGTYFIPVPG